MALFDLELTEGLNVVSIPLLLEDEAAKWSTILEGIAFNSVRTLTDGQWQDYLRGRPSELNDFDSVDFKKGYFIDVVRVGFNPEITTLLPSDSEIALNDYGDSVYSDETVALTSVPLEHTGAKWIRTINADATNSDASYLTFVVDRTTNLYVGYDASASTIPSWLDDWDDTGEEVIAGENTYNVFRLPVPVGSVDLPGNQNGGGDADNMYIVFMEEDPFPLTVNSPLDYEVTRLDEGKLTYLDRLYIVTDLPEEVEGIDWVRMNNSEYTDTSSNYFEVEIVGEANVYVAYPEDGCPLPTWLDEFDLLDEMLESNTISYKLYRRTYEAGTITLGGASAPIEGSGSASPGANYIVGIKRIGPASVTVTLEGEELTGITDMPIVGTDKGGVSLIGFPKSNTGETGIAENIDARGLQYELIMRVRKGSWDSYVPTRDEDLNWAPADLERGLGYLVRSTVAEDQVLEIDYDD